MQQRLQHLLEPHAANTSRLEVLEGPTGRRAWPDDVKLRIVAESYGIGVRVRDVAQKHGLTPQHLTLWRRAAREGRLTADAASQFVPLEIEEAAAPPPAAVAGMIEIEANGVIVRLPADTASIRIGAIAAELRQRR